MSVSSGLASPGSSGFGTGSGSLCGSGAGSTGGSGGGSGIGTGGSLGRSQYPGMPTASMAVCVATHSGERCPYRISATVANASRAASKLEFGVSKSVAARPNTLSAFGNPMPCTTGPDRRRRC